jgi:hypothetical protein
MIEQLIAAQISRLVTDNSSALDVVEVNPCVE